MKNSIKNSICQSLNNRFRTLPNRCSVSDSETRPSRLAVNREYAVAALAACMVLLCAASHPLVDLAALAGQGYCVGDRKSGSNDDVRQPALCCFGWFGMTALVLLPQDEGLESRRLVAAWLS